MNKNMICVENSIIKIDMKNQRCVLSMKLFSHRDNGAELPIWYLPNGSLEFAAVDNVNGPCPKLENSQKKNMSP